MQPLGHPCLLEEAGLDRPPSGWQAWGLPESGTSSLQRPAHASFPTWGDLIMQGTVGSFKQQLQKSWKAGDRPPQ